jgi:NADPH:quinone reductase-like Zn-dependent oxidoreductase
MNARHPLSTKLPHITVIHRKTPPNPPQTPSKDQQNTTMVVHTFTVFKGDETGKIVRSVTQRNLGPDEVLIRITHSGLCGTDCHYRASGCVLGHEGVGVVEEMGENAKRFKRGDVVGWGYIHKVIISYQRRQNGS